MTATPTDPAALVARADDLVDAWDRMYLSSHGARVPFVALAADLASALEASLAEKASAVKLANLFKALLDDANAENERLLAIIEKPPKHRFWGAGEPDCPREIKAPNGELHTLRCKACGLENPRDDLCRAALEEPRP